MKRIIKIDDDFIKRHKLGIKDVFVIQIANDLPFGFTVQDFLDEISPIVMKYDTAYRVLRRISNRGLIEVNWDNSNGRDLYLIEEESASYLKIGRSNNAEKRLKSLQTGSPLRLSIAYVLPDKGHLEKLLHEKFKKKRINGEWFTFSQDIVKEFESIIVTEKITTT